jgi:hypothetical protein
MGAVKVLLDNQYPLPIIGLKITSTRERFINEVNLEIAFRSEGIEEEDIFNTAEILNNLHTVVCIYIDGIRYFTGFVEGANDTEKTGEGSISVTLKSKTIDIMQSTYIPIIFDSVNGGANFLTNGEINFLNILKITLQKLGWIVVDPQGKDGDRRFTEYNVISIINKTSGAKKPIILDNKKGTAATERLFLDGTKTTTTIKSLKPSNTESVGAFLMRLANELGLILTTNADGDVVIEDASITKEPPLWQNFTKRISGDTDYNNITSSRIQRNYNQIHYKSYRIVHDGDDQNTPQENTNNVKSVPKASINDYARKTRHFAYNASETVNVQQQVASQEMMAKTMWARARQLSVTPISYRYTTIQDLQPDPEERKIIEAGDMVYVYIERISSNEIIDELMYVSEVSFDITKPNINVAVQLVYPEYYSNPSTRPRKQIIRQRKLSAI